MTKEKMTAPVASVGADGEQPNNKNHKKIPSRKPPEGIFYSFIALKIRNSLQISLFFFSLPLLQQVLLPGKALPFLLHLMYHQSWLLSLHLMYHLQYRYWMIHC